MTVRIGIISDTHGLLRPEVLQVLKSCSHIIHAGDITRENLLDPLRILGNLYVVRGNCDTDEWAEGLRKILHFKIENVRFVLTHEIWNVSSQDYKDADVVIFGHTHRYWEEWREGRLWLNPGSCGRSRYGEDVTMAVMEVSDGKLSIQKIVLE